MAKRITFTIDARGNATVKDVCGLGAGCQEATQDIEKLLGTADEGSRAPTESLYDKVDPLVLKNEA